MSKQQQSVPTDAEQARALNEMETLMDPLLKYAKKENGEVLMIFFHPKVGLASRSVCSPELLEKFREFVTTHVRPRYNYETAIQTSAQSL